MSTFAQRAAETLALRECTRCRLRYLSPQPSNDWLAEEYRNYYEKRKSSSVRPKQVFFSHLLKRELGSLDGLEVLELGAGEGDCAAAVQQQWPHAKMTVVEANPESQAHHGDLRAELVSESVEQWLAANRPRRYDVILLFDLIEHLRDPQSTLSQLAERHLKPGGRIMATFPNTQSWSRRWMGRWWFHYKVEHLFYFSHAAVAKLAEGAGLETQRLGAVRKYFPVDYFLAIASNFGPAAFTAVFRWIRRLVPHAFGKVRVPLYLGEWLWIARRPEPGPTARG